MTDITPQANLERFAFEDLRHDVLSVIAGLREFGDCVFQSNGDANESSHLFFLSLAKLEKIYADLPKGRNSKRQHVADGEVENEKNCTRN